MTEMIKDLIKAKKSFPKLLKRTTSRLFGSNYLYANLDDCIACVDKHLLDNNIFMNFKIDNKYNEYKESVISVQCVLTHVSGETMISSCESKLNNSQKMSTFHELGSSITYLKRYCLCAVLGISSDEDDDATAVSTPQIAQVAKKTLYNDCVSESQCEEIKKECQGISKEVGNVLWSLLKKDFGADKYGNKFKDIKSKDFVQVLLAIKKIKEEDELTTIKGDLANG